MSDDSTTKSANGNEKAKHPAWIQSELFEGLLKNLYHDFAQIVHFSVDNALAPGENYATVMLKVEIEMKLKDDTTKPISFMLKISHDSDIFRRFMKYHDVFETESGMYRDIVSQFEKLYADVGVKMKFGAKSYQLPLQEKYILLEDLKLQGFKNTNRLDGLNVEHTESVLKKLAQWHAASAVWVTRNGVFPKEYCTSFYKTEAYELIRELFEGRTKITLECIKGYQNSEIYYDKVAKLQSQITDELFKYTNTDFSEFNVLNHGDCWSNNIMFKYDEQGNILETYMVDYQMPRYDTPAYDLLYFLLSSTKLDIKLKEFDYFIKFYHSHLADNLKILDYTQSIPTAKDIHIAIYKYGVYGYIAATNIMAAVLCDPTDNASLDNFIADSEDGVNFQRLMYTNDRYRTHMEAVLPWMLYKGFLDS